MPGHNQARICLSLFVSSLLIETGDAGTGGQRPARMEKSRFILSSTVKQNTNGPGIIMFR